MILPKRVKITYEEAGLIELLIRGAMDKSSNLGRTLLGIISSEYADFEKRLHDQGLSILYKLGYDSLGFERDGFWHVDYEDDEDRDEDDEEDEDRDEEDDDEDENMWNWGFRDKRRNS